MSRQLPYHFNIVYKAILAATLGLGTLSANAITLGQPSVSSEQHQPLTATINVSGIDANNFSASLANSSIHQQMGFDQNSSIQVQFVKTSDTAGKIILSSSEPISSPFADVVLNLNNNGEQRIEPQTLLMPLPKQSRIEPTDATPVNVASEQDLSLPIVSSVELEPIGEPLQVQTVAPPPLFAETEEVVTNDANIAQAPTEQLSEEKNNTQTTTATQVAQDNGLGRIISKEERVISSITPEGTNTQLNILTEQITRRVLSSDVDGTISTATQPTDTLAEDKTVTETQQTSTPTYVVQSGDNLWNIANQIAKANNLNISEVMTALHKQNPNAFHHGKIDQLKANATLTIPNYSVVPSQKAIQDAISSRKGSSNATAQGKRSTTTRATTTRTTRDARGGSRTVAQPLPKPQLTLVTPSQSGQATGSQGKTGGNGDELVGTLRSTRAQTAQNARRVNSLNQELSSATQRLQLQNQKLAELEARLKALRDK